MLVGLRREIIGKMESGSVLLLIGCGQKPSEEGFWFLACGNLSNQQPTWLFIANPSWPTMPSVVVSLRSFRNRFLVPP